MCYINSNTTKTSNLGKGKNSFVFNKELVVMPRAKVVITIEVKECSECHQGVMEKPYPPHSYDYNEEGYVPPYCNNCGYGYKKKIITPRYLITRITNRSIESILKTLCERGRTFDYNIYKKLYSYFKDKRIISPHDLADDIIFMLGKHGVLMDWDTVVNIVYKKVSYSS